jgi:hypothetical protein
MTKTLSDLAHVGGVVPPKPDAKKKEPRENQKAIISWHNKAVRAQLKQIGIEQEKSQQKLIAEALNMLFVKYGKGPIA